MPRGMLVVMLAQANSCSGTCISSLDSYRDFGDDFCAYTSFAALSTAYNWHIKPGSSPVRWEDRYDDGSGEFGIKADAYTNIAAAVAPRAANKFYFTLACGLPYNGGSKALDFDSDKQLIEYPDSFPLVAVGATAGLRTFPLPSDLQKLNNVVTRIWIDGASSFQLKNYITPAEVSWGGSGGSGQQFVTISRYNPATLVDFGSPRIWLYIQSRNNATNVITVGAWDLGDAAPLIGYTPGHEFRLQCQVVAGTPNKLEADLRISKLPGGGAGGITGRWIMRRTSQLTASAYGQNLGLGDFGLQPIGFPVGSPAGRIHARLYSYEYWRGVKSGLPADPSITAIDDV